MQAANPKISPANRKKAAQAERRFGGCCIRGERLTKRPRRQRRETMYRSLFGRSVIGRSSGGGSGGGGPGLPHVAPTAPVMLNGISNVYIAYAVTRVVTGYVGPLFKIVRASDSTSLDVYADSTNYPVLTSIGAFLSGETDGTGYIIPYDQSGNGLHATQTDLTQCPKYKPATFKSLPSMCFDGYAALPSYTAHAGKRLILPTVSIDRKTMGCMVISQEIQQGNTGPFLYMNDSSTGLLWYYTQLGTGTNSSKRFMRMDSTTFTPGSGIASYMCSSPDLHGFSINGETTNNTTIYTEENSITVNSKATTTLIGGTVGGKPSVNGTGADFTGDIGMFVLFNAAPSGSDFSTVRTSAVSTFGLSVATDPNIECEGDSITGGLGCYENRSWTIGLRKLLRRTARVDNTGLVGELLTVMLAATNVNAQVVPRNLHTTRTSILHTLCGTNDIRVNASIDTAALATTYLAYCATQKAAGYIVIAATILPIGAAGVSGGQTYDGAEAARQDFNARIRAGSANYDGLADYAVDPVIGPQAVSADTAILTDGLHPSVFAQSVMSWIAASAMNPFL